MKKKFYVLLGDVISSRKISDREKFQTKFEETVEMINALYADDIYARFKILKGIDEIGCVLSTMSKSYEIITSISEQLHPTLMRFVLIFDYIDIGLETMDVSKMDGSAFHKASETMNTLKKSKLMFNMIVDDKIIDNTITGQINLIFLIKKNWSVVQQEIVKEYKNTNNQDQVARKLGITQQAVSKTLKRLMWKDITGIEEKLNYSMYDYMQRQKEKVV